MQKCGVLLPVFSLPGKRSVGTLGDGAYEFIDFLAEAGQSYWQILPLCPADSEGSPYRSDSAFACDSAFIDPYILACDGLLKESEIPPCEPSKRVSRRDDEQNGLLKKAFARFEKSPPKDYEDYKRAESYWLENYALFCALKESEGTADFTAWKNEYKFRDEKALKEYAKERCREIEFVRFVQYEFDRQWRALKEYAECRGIKIMGDMPMYVAPSSADVWGAPEIFSLDENLAPKLVAGVPPDAFTADGQLWGNPVYDWERLEESGYAWWLDRFRRASELYDVVRLDHFRGFESFYAVKAGAENARIGEWIKGGGEKFFDAVKKAYPKLEIIAEDLGVITDDVRALIAHTHFSNMKVLQFGLDGDERNEHNPARYGINSVAYTVTHDKDTCKGWYASLFSWQKREARKGTKKKLFESIADAMIRTLYESKAKWVIIPMQDFLGEGHESRINTPGTVGAHNWTYRLSSVPSLKIAKKMSESVKKLAQKPV